MKIVVGKYTIHGDKFCVWVMEEQPTKSRDGKIKTKQVKVGGYSPNYEQLLQTFITKKGISSDCTEIKGLLEDFAQTEKDMRVIAGEIGKKFDKEKKK